MKKSFFVSLLLCGCLFTCSLFAAAYDPVALYLTWVRNPESTMVIRWITALDRNDDVVEYTEQGKTEWSSAKGVHSQLPKETPYFIHSVELTNLKPGTNYLFRTGRDGVTYKFQTMPTDLYRPIRFVAGGDMFHDGLDTLRQTNQQAALTNPQFALVGGDIAYAASNVIGFLPRWVHPYVDVWVGQKFDRWLAWLVAWKQDMVTPDGCLIPMLPAIGNHDVSGRFGQTPAEAPFFYALFPMPGEQGYNVLDFGNYMSIFLLDSGHTHPVGGQQAAWLAKTLHDRKNVPHKYALYHVPAYPAVHRLTEEIATQIRKFWVPSFDAYHLTAAFENHEHLYKRTHPIKGGRIDSSGVIYVGDGGWGVDKPRRARRLDQKWFLSHVASARHFLFVVVEQEKQTVTAVGPEGVVIDTFSW
ncbi:MAG: fibronectin type III domain-containing protein [Parachlamydiaceae bacterium]